MTSPVHDGNVSVNKGSLLSFLKNIYNIVFLPLHVKGRPTPFMASLVGPWGHLPVPPDYLAHLACLSISLWACSNSWLADAAVSQQVAFTA